ncbi:hypothetical protein DY000_02014219 [Brassica cretica]|uniref:DUF1985 domain-containing protein n=1 Tax=Brassica cretica TaxID=69181 RepID=A0ABQ7DBI8_BRACR|nr:hypothetical protein DY000_02014219 [Brassica cretica]
MMGVAVDDGPTSEQVIAACGRCKDWSREDHMRLGYLVSFIRFIEGRKYSTSTRASLARLVMDLEAFENYPWGRVAFKMLMDSLKEKDLTKTYTVDGFIQVIQVWIYYALPKLAANYGKPLPNKPSPPLLAYKGGKYVSADMYFKRHSPTSRKRLIVKSSEKSSRKYFPEDLIINRLQSLLSEDFSNDLYLSLLGSLLWKTFQTT